MTTAPVITVTDELIAELEQLAGKVSAMALDSAEEVVTQSGSMIECPVCCGEGYATAENDYCNFDNHAIGVEFYGIGPEFGLAEAYFRAANPGAILALIAERAELKRELGGLRAARIAYASEFPFTLDGDPDTGSIHANIRELKLDAERYRWLFADDASWSGELEYAVFDDGRKPVVDSAIDAAMQEQGK